MFECRSFNERGEKEACDAVMACTEHTAADFPKTTVCLECCKQPTGSLVDIKERGRRRACDLKVLPPLLSAFRRPCPEEGFEPLARDKVLFSSVVTTD